ncbi:helix-hairpin-helix domain-containing protein [Pantanalinema rosaneae CENA516]|uniref:ComEA family DNA-binding protein n=1 Tax=Pantanalinema rosaneae TaxID=1620701 RepID=UPI003D6F11DE
MITGSHNWTAAANTGNDETVLVIHNPVVAAHYQREFERLYTNAILGVPPAIRHKAAEQQRQCAKLQATAATAISGSPSDRPPSPTPQVRRATTRPQQAANRTTVPAQRSPHSNPRVNLNTATQAELEALPGVGPSLAKRIIAARQRQPFRSLADLDRVSGVGPKLLTKLKDHVTW